MRGPNLNAREARPVSCVEKECGVQIETAMRIRPLSKKERDDTILLEERKNYETNGEKTVILNPLKPHLLTQNDSTSCNDPTEYHFDHVLPESTSQDKIYYTLGLPIVTATMNSLKNSSSNRMPKSHLLISIGVENSGKTYTCFGGMTIPKRRATQDGLVPRLLDSLFSHSSHTGSGSKGFIVQMSIMQVTQPKGGQLSDPDSCQIHDLLSNPSNSSKNKMFSASPKKKKNLNVRNMAARFERVMPSPIGKKTQGALDGGAVLDAENLKPTIQNCHDISEAREALQNGLSISQKSRTGNQVCNLYITMQPMVDGTKIGDKICILDMSGLEKENTMQNNYGKEGGASTINQAAHDAIFNCLRTLKHNSNILGSKSNSSRKKVKPIPFRDHKVTMLLNPLFLQSSSVKITLLLAAYPGHTDFQQKLILLKNVEILHSITLGVAENSTKSEVRNRNDQHESHNDQKAAHDPSSFRRDERPNYYPPKESRDSRASVKVSSIATRMTKKESIHSSRRDYSSPAELSADKILRAESTNISRASKPVTKSNVRLIARKQQDRSSLVYRHSNERKVEPSAPAFSDAQESLTNSKKLKECAVDFPGLEITPNTERNVETGNGSLAKHYSVPATTRPRRKIRDTREDMIVTKTDKKSSVQPVRNPSDIDKRGEIKFPLGRSSLENCENTTPNKIGKIHAAHRRTEDYNTSQEYESTSNYFEADFPTFEHKTEGQNDEQIKKLEEKLRETLEEKKALEKICFQLENENAELKQLSRETGRNILQPKLTQKEEEEFLACRKLRLEAQNKIKAPIHEHLERVNYIYEIKNQWCMTNKKHFSLTLPDHFQRAPVLDMRDKETQHFEDLKNLNRNETHKDDEIEIKKIGLTNMRMSVTPTRPTPPRKVLKSPEGLSALRRLAGKTLKN